MRTEQPSLLENERNNRLNIKPAEIKEALVKFKLDDNGDIELDPKTFAELSRTLYEGFKKELLKADGWLCEDVSALYDYFLKKNQELIIRREDPEKVFNLVTAKNPITIESSQLGLTAYPNCALFGGISKDMSGAETAFEEGWGAAGGLVATIGFRKNEESMTVIDLPDEQIIRNDKHRAAVRSFTGTIKPEDLAFVVIRTPSSLKLAGNKNEKGFYSFIGFIFNEEQKNIQAFFSKNKKEASYKKAS